MTRNNKKSKIESKKTLETLAEQSKSKADEEAKEEEPKALALVEETEVKKAAEAKKVAAKKRPSPQRPTGKMKETDYTNEVVATKFIGGVAMVDVKNASGGTGFKRDLIKALKANDKTREELGVISIVNRKATVGATDSKPATVGTKGALDKVILMYVQEGEGEDEYIQGMLVKFATLFSKVTMPVKSGGSKPKARAGRVINPAEAMHADEVIFNNDIANVITALFEYVMTDGTFDDDDATEELLSDYFSLTSIEEAKELVMEAYRNS